MLGYYLINSAAEYCALKWLHSIIEVREAMYNVVHDSNQWKPQGYNQTPSVLYLGFYLVRFVAKGSIKVRKLQVLPLGKNPYHVGRLTFPISTTITITSFLEMGKKVNLLEIHTL